MRRYSYLVIWIIGLGSMLSPAYSQELHATVTIQADQIKTTDPKVFQTLRTAVEEFLNNRSWTGRSYAPNERIDCNFQLNLQQESPSNVYKGTLTVQSSRPVYNATYTSSMLNYLDKNVSFKYVEFQPLNFNENRISGNDPLESNLTALLAYYAYVIIGIDEDSFAKDGGSDAFKKAQNIVSNAPDDSRNISGWKAFEGTRNRYWITDNLLNARLSRFHTVLYDYHRMGLDKMYDKMNDGRSAILNALATLNAINAENPNTMILQLFFTAKSDELTGVFSQAPVQDKLKAAELLSQLDPSNSSAYQQLTK